MNTVNEILTVHHNNIPLNLYCTHPEKEAVSLPTVVIFPTWSGSDMFCEHKANLMAQKGYMAVVVDLYGEKRQGQGPQECTELMMPFIDDRTLLKERMMVIFEHLKKDLRVDKNKMLATGYCFGGLCVLDAVRNNLGLKGGVCIHGLYNKPTYDLPPKYKSKLLVLHGYQDPMSPPDHLAGFQQELYEACDDWQVISFGLGKHAFTNPQAFDESRGTVYHALLDKRTTRYVDLFIRELFL